MSGCGISTPDWMPRLWWQQEERRATLPRVWLASPLGADVSPAQLQAALDTFNAGRSDLRAELVVPVDYADALDSIRVGEEIPLDGAVAAPVAVITGTEAVTTAVPNGASGAVTGTVTDPVTDTVTALQAEAPIDLLYVDSYTLPDLVADGALMPFSTVISGTNIAAATSDFYPPLLDAFSVDGELYCLPHSFNTLALVYNRTLFDQAAQPYPTAAWRWDDLIVAAQAVVDLDITFFTTYGLSLNADASRWLPFLYAAGGELVSDDGSQMAIDNATTLDSLNAYLNLLFDGLALRPADLSSSWNGEAFAKGRTGMTIEGNWIVPYLQEAYPDVDFGIAPLPRGAAGLATLFFSGCYAISAHSEQPVAALELALHLTSIDTLRAWSPALSAAPARISLRETWLAQHPIMEPFLSGLEYARPWQFAPGMHPTIEALNSGMVQALNGDIPPEEVLRVAEVIGNEVLEGAE